MTVTTAFAGGDKDAVSFPEADQTVLMIAQSTDGLRFEKTGEVLLVGGASPDLTLLPNGAVLLLFDRGDGLGVARSRDEGRTWSKARRVRIHGGGRKLSPHHGDLVVVPGGYLRLFFAAAAPSDRGRPTLVVRSAVTRDGANYRLDRALHLPLPRGDSVYPVAGWVGDRLHVLVGDEQGVHRAISRDGRRFGRLLPFEAEGGTFAGSMITVDNGARMYTSTRAGMRVLESVEGRTWRVRGGASLPEGWDPAVVQIDRDRYLMVYCAPRTEESLASSQLITIEDVGGEWGDSYDAETWDDSTGEVVDAETADVPDSELSPEDAGLETPDIGDDEVAEGEVPLTEASVDVELAEIDEGAAATEVVLMQDFDEGGGLPAGYDPVANDGFAPHPGFLTKVDFLEWYKQYEMGDPDDNAWYAYAEFMPLPDDEPGAKPEFPDFNDMFNGGNHEGPPGPWDPAEHPEWERTHVQAADLIEKYKQASKHENYAQPLYQSPEGGVDQDQRDLLIWITLPTLSTHRTMAKAMLADAWREVDGKVSSARMLDAFETTLRAAGHMHQGTTLIEELVGESIGNLTRENARWALKEGVFAPDELESVLDTLQRYESNMVDPVRAMRGEHAFAMDLTQHLFTPPTAEGLPHFNRERALKTFPIWNDEGRAADLLERTSRMTPDDVYETIDTMETHYREMGELMRIGYPQVRAADITALEKKSYATNALTEAMMPSFGRYHQLRTRGQAARRATQLAYATELFKARNGRYPNSLDELPNDHGETMKIDPFTGDYFGYRLTDDGPRIYSLSEDGVDSGGSHSPTWDRDGGNADGSDDYVFWPPQPR